MRRSVPARGRPAFDPTRRSVLVGMAAAAAAPATALAQAFPSRQPIRLIVPYPPGGGTDFFARTVSARMSEELGQRILVENRPGAATIIGAETAANAPADGYTVLLGDTATYAVNPALYKKLPYDPVKNFAPVTLTARFALLLVVNPQVPVGSVKELIAMAKSRPGQLNFGSPGTGSPHHLAMELFEQRAGIDLTHVPYKGGAPATQDLLAGSIPVMFLDLATAAPHIKAGKLKALAVASDKRLGSMPNLPTVAEAADLTGYEAWAWQGLSVPAGTPADAIARLNAAYAKAATDESIRQKMNDAGADLIPSTPQAMAEYVRGEMAKWARTVREANLTVE